MLLLAMPLFLCGLNSLFLEVHSLVVLSLTDKISLSLPENIIILLSVLNNTLGMNFSTHGYSSFALWRLFPLCSVIFGCWWEVLFQFNWHICVRKCAFISLWQLFMFWQVSCVLFWFGFALYNFCGFIMLMCLNIYLFLFILHRSQYTPLTWVLISFFNFGNQDVLIIALSTFSLDSQLKSLL